MAQIMVWTEYGEMPLNSPQIVHDSRYKNCKCANCLQSAQRKIALAELRAAREAESRSPRRRPTFDCPNCGATVKGCTEVDGKLYCKGCRPATEDGST